MATQTIVIKTTTDITTLTPADFGAISSSDIAKLSASQVGDITAEQMAKISVEALSVIKQKSLAADVFGAIPVKAVAGLNFKLVSAEQFNNLTSTQIAALTPAQVSTIPNATFNDMSIDALNSFGLKGNFTALDMKKLDASNTHANFDKFTSTQIGALTSTQLNALSASQLGGITAEQAVGFVSTQMPALASTFVRGLDTEAVNALSPATFKAIPAKSLNNFADTALTNLSEEKLATLTSAHINALSANKLAFLAGHTSPNENFGTSLSNAALDGISKVNIAGLDIANLSDSQFAALGTAQLNLLSTSTGVNYYEVSDISLTQAAAITPKQAAGLSTTFVRALISDDVAALTPATVAALAPKTFASMTADSSFTISGNTATAGIKGTIAGLTQDNMASLTSAHIAALSAAQIESLAANDDLQYVPNSALAGIGKSNIAGLDLTKLIGDGQFAALSPAQLNLLAVTTGTGAIGQVEDITTEQMDLLTAKQAAGLSKAFVGALTATQIQHLTPAALAAIPPASFGSFVNLVGGLTEDNGPAVTSAQLATLTAAKVDALSTSGTTGFAYLSTAAMAGLNKVNIVNGSDYLNTNNMTEDQLATLKPAQIMLFNSNQMNSLTVNPNALTSSVMSVLSAAQVGAIPAATIAAMDPAAFAGFNSKNISGLADGVGSAMTKLTSEQTSYLSADAVKGLMAGQLDNITTDAALTSDAFSGIKPASLKAMTASAITSIVDATFKGITPDQVKVLTVDQIAALKNGQIALFGPDDAESFTAAQLGKMTAVQASNLATDAIPSIPNNAISRLDISQFDVTRLPKITNDQFLKLSAAQIATINPATGSLIASITNDQVTGVGTLNALKAGAVPLLNAPLVNSLTPLQMGKFDNAHLAEFTAKQAISFSDDVIKAFGAKGYTLITNPTDTTNSGIIITNVFNTPSTGGEVVTAGRLPINVTGSTAAETIIGSTGADTISGGASSGHDSITSGAGNDGISVSGESNVHLASWTIDGGDGNDTLTLSTTTTALVDSDLLRVMNVERLALTGASSVTVGTNATTGGIKTVVVDAANTTVTGNSAPFAIDASSLGANTLTLGGSGTLTITGSNANAETYQFGPTASLASGNLDVITNYQSGTDKIKFGSTLTAIADNLTTAAVNSPRIEDGFATFADADSTTSKKLATLQTYATSLTDKTVAFSDGTDTYVFYTGTSTTGPANDQLIKLAGLKSGSMVVDTNVITRLPIPLVITSATGNDTAIQAAFDGYTGTKARVVATGLSSASLDVVGLPANIAKVVAGGISGTATLSVAQATAIGNAKLASGGTFALSGTVDELKANSQAAAGYSNIDAVTMTGTSAAAADLVLIGTAATVPVTGTTITSITTSSVSDTVAALVTAGTKVTVASNASVALSGTTALATDLTAIDGVVGTVTGASLTSISGSAVEVKAVTDTLATIVVGTVTGGVSNANATITGTSAAASDLTAIDAKVGTVTGATLATITGNISEVKAVTDNLATIVVGTVTGGVSNANAVVSGTSAAASDLTAIDAKVGTVTGSTLATITGTGTQVAAVGTAIAGSTITLASNWNSAPTGSLSITEANTINANNGSGTITGALDVTSSVSDLKTLTGTHAYTIVIAAGDATSAAADLALIDAATNIAVGAANVTTVTGTATEVAAFAAAETGGTITAAATYAATVSGTDMTVNQANAIDAANGNGVTTGSIVVTESVATLKTLTGTHAYTIVIAAGDANSAAADLALINAATSVAVDATAVTSLTGSESGDTIDLTAVGVTWAASAMISINGGVGADTLTGRTAVADTFVFASSDGNKDTIIDNITALGTGDVIKTGTVAVNGTNYTEIAAADYGAATTLSELVTAADAAFVTLNSSTVQYVIIENGTTDAANGGTPAPVATTDSYLMIDWDFDGTTDQAILLTGVTDVTAANIAASLIVA